VKPISKFQLDLPDWVGDTLSGRPELWPSEKNRMDLVVELSRKNYRQKTGGPFAAGVFEMDSGRLVSIGVNRVTQSNCSSAHAEVMALSLAQKRLGTWDLGAEGLPAHQLVVNWRPCIMCYGAIIWSGIRSLVVAGDGPQLEEITGFDEGPLGSDWKKALEMRGITVISGLLTEEACDVFREFSKSGALVYNPSRDNL
jgi:tRNA(Arg) A34 adenosine deaminase TadA